MAITPDRTNNPIKITGTTATSTVVTPNTVLVKAIVWVGATTNAHKCSLTDTAGNQLWEATMATSCLTENINFFPAEPVQTVGIYCDDLDSGTVYIYI